MVYTYSFINGIKCERYDIQYSIYTMKKGTYVFETTRDILKSETGKGVN